MERHEIHVLKIPAPLTPGTKLLLESRYAGFTTSDNVTGLFVCEPLDDGFVKIWDAYHRREGFSACGVMASGENGVVRGQLIWITRDGPARVKRSATPSEIEVPDAE